MILSMIIVLVFAVALLVLRARNRLALVFFGGFISVDILILSLFLYIMKINSYNYFFQFEYYLIRFIGKIKLSYYDTKYLMLIAIVMLMVVMMYFYIDGSVKHTFVKTKIRDIILFTVGTMIFVVVNSNIYHESVFLWRHTVSPDKLKLIDVIADFSSLYSIVYIGIMCILPYRMFMYEYRTTELFFRKKYLSSIMLAILFLQSIFLFVLFFSPLKYFFMESGIYDIGNLSNRYKSDFDYYIVIVVLVLLTLIGAIFINSQILKEVNLFKVKYSGKKTKFSFKEVRHVFHSFKNLMALLTILNNDAIENYGTKESKENLIEMQDNIEQFSIMMNRILDVSNYNKMNYDCVNIVSCVKNAVSKFSHIEKKKVNLQIQCNEVMVYGENYGFAEAFNNLLCNAGAAIPPDGEITVKVWTENKWVCISFRDNGCGIPKKM